MNGSVFVFAPVFVKTPFSSSLAPIFNLLSSLAVHSTTRDCVDSPKNEVFISPTSIPPHFFPSCQFPYTYVVISPTTKSDVGISPTEAVISPKHLTKHLALVIIVLWYHTHSKQYVHYVTICQNTYLVSRSLIKIWTFVVECREESRQWMKSPPGMQKNYLPPVHLLPFHLGYLIF